MFPIRLRTDESTTAVGELLQLSAEIGAEGAVLFGGLLVLYAIIGAIIPAVVNSGAPYPMYTFESDPVFPLSGTIIGIFTVQGAGSLLLYHFYVGIEDESVASVALSFVALGVGGALLEMSLPKSCEFLGTVI